MIKYPLFIGTGLSIGLYDRKYNTFLIKYSSSDQFIKLMNKEFSYFYDEITKDRSMEPKKEQPDPKKK